jgi:hypothetical protein
MDGHLITIILIGALILFGIFRRISRNIGWQLLIPRRIIVRTAIFCFIGLIFLSAGATKPISLISDIAGIIIGVGLAFYSGVLTRYERRDGKLYYRPNTWIGLVVIALFLGRLIYRFYKMYMIGKTINVGQNQTGNYQTMQYMAGNSWTAGLVLIMFAYYVIYYIILLRNQKKLVKEENFIQG